MPRYHKTTFLPWRSSTNSTLTPKCFGRLPYKENGHIRITSITSHKGVLLQQMFVHNGWWWTLISSDESSVMDGNWVLLCECNNTCGVLMEWGCEHISFLSSFMWILLSLAGSAPSPAQAESGRGWEEAGSGVRVASVSVMRTSVTTQPPGTQGIQCQSWPVREGTLCGYVLMFLIYIN